MLTSSLDKYLVQTNSSERNPLGFCSFKHLLTCCSLESSRNRVQLSSQQSADLHLPAAVCLLHAVSVVVVYPSSPPHSLTSSCDLVTGWVCSSSSDVGFGCMLWCWWLWVSSAVGYHILTSCFPAFHLKILIDPGTVSASYVHLQLLFHTWTFPLY